MARLVSTDFCQFEFETTQEERQAQILTEGNIQHIRNKLSLAMQERAQLEFDAEKPITVFVQAEAALMGEIRAYQFLIDAHNMVIEELKQLDPQRRD